MTRGSLRKLLSPFFEAPAIRLLAVLGVSPNAVTAVGLLGAMASAVLLSFGQLAVGGAMFLLFGALDLLDGSLARATGRATPSGAFLDSVTDRVSESVVFLGILIFYINSESPLNSLFTPRLGVLLVYIAIVSSVMVSYVRARSEAVGVDGSKGIMARPERVAMVGAGLIVGQWWVPAISLTLGLIATGSIITSLQRVVHVHRILGQRDNRSL